MTCNWLASNWLTRNGLTDDRVQHWRRTNDWITDDVANDARDGCWLFDDGSYLRSLNHGLRNRISGDKWLQRSDWSVEWIGQQCWLRSRCGYVRQNLTQVSCLCDLLMFGNETNTSRAVSNCVLCKCCLRQRYRQASDRQQISLSTFHRPTPLG